jgi:hypothetical protein
LMPAPAAWRYAAGARFATHDVTQAAAPRCQRE